MQFDPNQTSNRAFAPFSIVPGTIGSNEVLGGKAMKSACILLAMSISILGISPAQAQTTVDLAKITCRQFLLGHVGGSTRSVANWLSGYYNGKRGNTVIEVESMQKNVRDLERYCRKNHEMPVMDAAKNALGAEK
jgi:acid stress chaperone HdeB